MLDKLRIERDIARANGLVAVLRVGLGLIAPGLAGVVLFTIAAADDLSGRGKRFFRDTKRVRSHVGDEADRALFPQLHAFVELLGEHHRPLRRQVQLSRGLLLKAGGNKGRRWIFPALRLFDALHRKGFSRNLREDLIYVFSVSKVVLFGVAVIPRGKAAGLSGAVERCVDRPVFLRRKSADLIFAVDHEPRRNRLHASGRQAPAHLLPK